MQRLGRKQAPERNRCCQVAFLARVAFGSAKKEKKNKAYLLYRLKGLFCSTSPPFSLTGKVSNMFDIYDSRSGRFQLDWESEPGVELGLKVVQHVTTNGD